MRAEGHDRICAQLAATLLCERSLHFRGLTVEPILLGLLVALLLWLDCGWGNGYRPRVVAGRAVGPDVFCFGNL